MSKSEIITLFVVLLVAIGAVGFMFYSNSTGQAWFRMPSPPPTPVSVPTPTPTPIIPPIYLPTPTPQLAPPAPTPVPIPKIATQETTKKTEIPQEAKYFLQSGKLTTPGPEIKNIKINPIFIDTNISTYKTAEKPWEEDKFEFNIIRGILNYVKNFPVIKTDYDPNSWQLTVNNIFTRGINSNQCGQYAKLFVTLARLNGIPAKFSTAYYEYWADAQKSQGCWDWVNIKGHAYAKVYVNGKWYAVDPQSGTFVDVKYRKIIDQNKGNAKAIVNAEGRDNADYMKYLDRWCLEGLRYHAAIPDLPWCSKIIITRDMMKMVTECKTPLKTLEFEQQKKGEKR